VLCFCAVHAITISASGAGPTRCSRPVPAVSSMRPFAARCRVGRTRPPRYPGFISTMAKLRHRLHQPPFEGHLTITTKPAFVVDDRSELSDGPESFYFDVEYRGEVSPWRFFRIGRACGIAVVAMLNETIHGGKSTASFVIVVTLPRSSAWSARASRVYSMRVFSPPADHPQIAISFEHGRS